MRGAGKPLAEHWMLVEPPRTTLASAGSTVHLGATARRGIEGGGGGGAELVGRTGLFVYLSAIVKLLPPAFILSCEADNKRGPQSITWGQVELVTAGELVWPTGSRRDLGEKSTLNLARLSQIELGKWTSMVGQRDCVRSSGSGCLIYSRLAGHVIICQASTEGRFKAEFNANK